MTLQEQTYPLVSILTPVYNGAAFLDRFLRMILAQTYPNIELILVDDGSTDNGFRILPSFDGAFVQKGYSLRCFYQEHAGAAAAVNRGLLEFSGAYLKWMDCDDLLMPSCIEEEICFLTEHPECGFVICDSLYVHDDSLEPLRRFGRTINGNDDYFWDILRGNHNYSLGSGTILVSRENLHRSIPEMQIAESPEGQNYQLMLPLTYHFSCGYLRRPLFQRVVREDSHSARKRSYRETMSRYENFIVMLKETIRRMRIPEEKEAFDLIERRFVRLQFDLACENHDPSEVIRCGKILRGKKALSRRETLKWFAAKYRTRRRAFRKARERNEN